MCFGVLALIADAGFAQNVTSSIIGRVVDPANAVLAAAPIILTDQNTGATRSAATDASGNLRFADIAPGTYTISVQAPGFKALIEKDIVVSASETRDIGTIRFNSAM